MMKFNLTMTLVLLTLLFIPLPSLAQETTETVFVVGQYADPNIAGYENNMKVEKTLSLPDADKLDDELQVVIQGEVEECCDYIIIYDQDKQQIGKYAGQLDEKLIVNGNTIHVTFFSDRRTTKKGFKISIAKRLSAIIFNEIKEQLFTLTEQILTFGTQQIFSQLQTHLNAFNKLQEQIAQSFEIEPLIAQISQQLVHMSETYQIVAAKNAEINQFHQQQFEQLKQLIARTDLYIKKIYSKKEYFLTKVTEAQNQLKALEVPLERQKIEYTINSYRKLQQNLYAQKELWEKFHVLQKQTQSSLETYSQAVSILFHVLNVNAQVYKEAANLAIWGQFFELKNNLSNQQELQSIINSIKESEKNILELIAKVKNLTLSIEPKKLNQ